MNLLVPILAYFMYAACPFPFLLLLPQLGQVDKVRASGVKEGEREIPVEFTKDI